MAEEIEVVDTPVETTVETPEPTISGDPVAPSNDGTLMGKSDLTEVAEYETTPNEDYDYPEGFFDDKGAVNKDSIKEYLGTKKEADEKYEKRILDLRRKVSDGKVLDKSEEYHTDFAPADEKFLKFFDDEATKGDMKIVTDALGAMYQETGLSKRQGEDITNTMLRILESVDVIDTKTKEESFAAKQKWIEEQERELGSNAKNIIREARLFIETAAVFSAKTKNELLGMMEKQGAPFISTIHQMKDAYGGNSAGVPVDVSALGGLASDMELKTEYMNKDTSDLRRNEIIQLRARAGRAGRLMDAEM